jgi:hypothetical protein
MAKDKKGNFHPLKGKPSGRGRKKGMTTPPPDKKALDEQFELEDKYSIDSDRQLADGVRMKHPNRNTDKDQDRKPDNMKRQSVKSRRMTSSEDLSGITPEELPISKETINNLASNEGRCITIYLPTHRTGAEVNEQVDPTIFKELIQRAAGELRKNNEDDTRILDPAYKLMRNDMFWKSLPSGLAFFISKDFFKYTRLPMAPTQKLRVNSQFLLSPLLPFITSQDYFYLLIISKQQSKLFRADRFQMQHIPISELPRGMDDVIHFEEKDDQKLFRTGSSGAGGGANYHGIGAGKPDDKENISMYLAEVDNTLWQEVLSKETAPLLLAGVDYLIPIYKKVSRYNNIWTAALTGSLEYENENELYRRAMDVMKDYFKEKTKLALANYGDKSATSLTSDDLTQIIPGAYYSRIDHLFVEKDADIWGTFDEKNQIVSVHDQEQPGDIDLLDNAAVRTYLNGGTVHMLSKEEMPARNKMAALMRY